MSDADLMTVAARELRDTVAALSGSFQEPVTHVYNPIDYAWDVHVEYIRRYGSSRKRIVFWGMNPGPWGMVQTGVPFGEVSAVSDWLGLKGLVQCPKEQHPKRPIQGFACERSEVSGRRLWGLFKERFGASERFFREHFVANYCPLVFMEKSGRNRTPDKIPTTQSKALYSACDLHFLRVVEALQPQWVIGIGIYAEKRALHNLSGSDIRVGRILHPSPASPAANRDWAAKATEQLIRLTAWS